MSDFYKTLLAAGGSFLIGCICTLLVSRFLKNIFSRLTNKTKSKTDDYLLKIVVDTIKPLGLIISALLSLKILNIGDEVNNMISSLGTLACVILIVRLTNKVSLKLIQRWSVHINDDSISMMLNSLAPLIRALVWGIGSAFYLQNIGVQMTAIWALLSAGGIGAGLALKEPVQEFFEYITILLDKPFQNGQFININNVWAKVERVGVRSTRLRSINGEIIVMSNSTLTNGVISNYAEMERRRLVHKLGVVYDTSYEKMKQIPSIIKDIVNNTDNAIFDRCHFIKFGDSSLDLELVYYIPTNDYLLAMSAQQTINLEIMRSFEENNIDFAYPTQTINVNRIEE